MTSDDRDITQPTEHERRVADELEERTGESEGPLGHDDVLTYGDQTDEQAGGTDRPTYDEEVEAERAGTTAEEVREDDDSALDSAYKPRTG
ncbi:MAG TPA: hypothetical protein VHK28_01665 [Candidatus Limnocylindria bacterium]|nr:hypothetical protein [Candidatus Limnocylindria bacterium]